MENVDGIKRSIRKEMRRNLDALSPTERERAGILLTERILGHQWFYRAEYVLGFVSYGNEISTWEILGEALRMGKAVYLPKVVREEVSEMRFYRIDRLEQLAEGYKGIMEPAGDSEEYELHKDRVERTVMLMPGVAFDGLRNRIGYGRGFYDRFLAGKDELQLHTIAVGYKCQLVDKLPASDTDIKPCQVICV